MIRDTNKNDEREVTQEKYTPDQDRSLTDAVLETSEKYREEDVFRADFVLYDGINPDTLDNLFRHETQPRTNVAFHTDDIRVALYGDDGAVIEVRDQPS